ncbi:polysaccharide export protein [Caballeronia fortuita]|uniref:Polysaccharide export protein n=2 Tax=Caballeronia fortuita TaxID=1777138 RepID=A0A157Z1A4_9BURK|nr:polysaccharide export protein [Caballeronia fortuita]
MHFLRRTKSALLAAVPPLLLSACAFAPGMHFDPSVPVDPTDASSTPHVTAITPELLRQQKSLREAETGDTYRSLIGSPKHYVIGPADVLSIIVWDHPELVVPNLTYTIGDTAGTLPTGPGLSSQAVPGFVVGDDGNIQFPYVGSLKAAGRTVAEVQAILQRQLSPYVKDPQVTVSVVAYRSKRIFVEGQVAQPGVKPITNVPMSLAEALSEANGVVAGIGDTGRIQLLRGGRTYELSLSKLADAGIDASMIALHDRDVVRVPPQTYNQVFVTGEVIRPTALPMHDGRLSLSDALASASGVNPATSKPAAIYVVRATSDPASPQVFHLDSTSPVGLALAEHFELQPKDVVYVDATGLARWARVVNLLMPSAQGMNLGKQVAGY